MSPLTAILPTFLIFPSFFHTSHAVIPPLVSQTPECFHNHLLEYPTPFAKDCRAVFGPLSVARNDTLYAILRPSASLKPIPSSQGTKNYLRISSILCDMTAVALVRDTEGDAGELDLKEWVQLLWPTFTESLQYILDRCVGNNIGGDSILEYTATSPVAKVKLVVLNKQFQRFRHLDDFAYYDAGLRGAGLLPSPVSSNSSASHRHQRHSQDR